VVVLALLIIFGCSFIVLTGVNELVINAIVKLCVVVNFVLTILISAPGCKFDHFLLRLHRCHFKSFLEELLHV